MTAIAMDVFVSSLYTRGVSNDAITHSFVHLAASSERPNAEKEQGNITNTHIVARFVMPMSDSFARLPDCAAARLGERCEMLEPKMEWALFLEDQTPSV